MAIIQSGAAPTSLLTVDPTFAAARITERPPEILGAYSISVASGLLTGISAGTIASPQPVFAWRWAPSVTTQLCMIRRIEVGFNTTIAFGTAQSLQYNLLVLRGYSATYTVNATTLLFTNTNTAKQRTSMPVSAFSAPAGSIQMATTAAMTTSSVFTSDTQFLSTINGSSTAIGTSIPMTPIFQHQPGDYPLIFANNEGFMINNGQAMGATGVGNLIVNVEWMELAATTGNAIAY
jgi:hypothetical protein